MGRAIGRGRRRKIFCTNHQPDPLDPKLVAELSRIIATVEKSTKNTKFHEDFLVHLRICLTEIGGAPGVVSFVEERLCDLNWNCSNLN